MNLCPCRPLKPLCSLTYRHTLSKIWVYQYVRMCHYIYSSLVIVTPSSYFRIWSSWCNSEKKNTKYKRHYYTKVDIGIFYAQIFLGVQINHLHYKNWCNKPLTFHQHQLLIIICQWLTDAVLLIDLLHLWTQKSKPSFATMLIDPRWHLFLALISLPTIP